MAYSYLKRVLRSDYRRNLNVGIGIAAMAFSTQAYAQDQNAGPQSNAEIGAGEIIVTAERRETSLQKTPLSIVVVDDKAIEAKGLSTVEDIARFTPGLSAGGDVEGGGIKPVFVIRGIGQSSGRETVERGVGLYVDDIYIPRTTGTFLQLLDVERVEILRGPQGTLFGRNSTGGAIRYVTRKPGKEFEAKITGAVGSFNRVDVTGLINLPVTEDISTRFQFGTFNRDGYIDVVDSARTRGDLNDVVARGTLRYDNGGRFTLDVGASYQLSKSYAPALTVLGNDITSPQSIALSRLLVRNNQAALAVNDPRFVLADKYANHGQCFVGVNTFGLANNNGRNAFNDKQGYCADFGVRQRNFIAFADARLELSGDVSARSVTGYVNGSSDATTDWTAMGIFYTRENSTYSSFSQELQLNVTAGPVEAVGGLYYFTENPLAENQNRNLVFQGPVSPNTGVCCSGFDRSRDLQTNSYGIFGQATISITDELSVILGGRYSLDKKDITVRRTDRPTAAPGVAANAKDKWGAFNYRLTLQYQPTPVVMVYATATSGFKSGGFNDDVQAVPAANSGITPYEPESVKSYEAGIRTQLFDRRLRANLTGFFMDYRDLQLATPRIDLTGGSPQVLLALDNAGRVQLWGVEGELDFRVSDHFSLSAAFATLDQKYKTLDAGSALLITSTCTNAATPTFATCAAQDVARSPKLQYTAGANYRLPLANGGEIGLSAAYAWIDEQQSSNSSTNTILLPSYGTLNLRAQYTAPSQKWSVGLYGTNVLDEYYLSSATNFKGFFGTITGAPGRPAEFGIDLKAQF